MNLLPEAVRRLFSRPSTRRYPKQKPLLPEGFRGKVEWDREACTFCMLCATNCPVNAITINKENKIWAIDNGKCIFCGKCHDVCPTNPKAVSNSGKYELAGYDRTKFNEMHRK
jgi:formate hydrogenlyase subunit 6/NADH:ubiquinone oxidoreductase subunit I